MTDQEKRGGPGRGQGRKPVQQGAETVTVSLRMTPGQRTKLAQLGGAQWVRAKIDQEMEMGNVRALKVLDGGLLEHSQVGIVDANTWADSIGRILADSGRTETVVGWGHMDGEVRVLIDEMGRDAYYIST